MQQFRYTAYDQSGTLQEGEVSSLESESACVKLKEQGLIPTSIIPVKSSRNVALWRNLLPGGGRPGTSDIEFMTAQMVILLKNGIKIDRALEIASRSVANPKLKQIVIQLNGDVRSGQSLASLLSQHADIFSPLYISVVAIGEATGRLAEAFSELAANLAFHKEVTAKTRQALAYPSVIFVVCILSVIFIFNFVVPRFETLFSRMANPPLATQVLLQMSHLFRQVQWGLLIGVAAVPIALRRLLKNAAFRNLTDTLLLNLPITRRLIYSLENLRFVSSMSLLLQRGVLLVDALSYAIQSVGNRQIRRRLLTVRDGVKQGQPLSDTIAKTGFFPDIYTGVLEVGEQAGSLLAVFQDMEHRMRTGYEQQLTALITLIEPVMIVVMGGIVGSIVVIMMLSIVSLQQMPF